MLALVVQPLCLQGRILVDKICLIELRILNFATEKVGPPTPPLIVEVISKNYHVESGLDNTQLSQLATLCFPTPGHRDDLGDSNQ